MVIATYLLAFFVLPFSQVFHPIEHTSAATLNIDNANFSSLCFRFLTSFNVFGRQIFFISITNKFYDFQVANFFSICSFMIAVLNTAHHHQWHIRLPIFGHTDVRAIVPQTTATTAISLVCKHIVLSNMILGEIRTTGTGHKCQQ